MVVAALAGLLCIHSLIHGLDRDRTSPTEHSPGPWAAAHMGEVRNIYIYIYLERGGGARQGEGKSLVP